MTAVPTFYRIAPGVYDSVDGRLTMYRIEGLNPPGWNIELHTDYVWRMSGHENANLHEIWITVVDGAVSMHDALAIMRQEWPQIDARLSRIESVVPTAVLR